ncbi:MAG TPA: DUF2442 domain-containing protein [Candidatus Baltobacteraceae bacterium]|jgi:hypothetical protein|nr:DUF2442 domain-containing protein [Candidatus Baltobacteraceae bacterium]
MAVVIKKRVKIDVTDADIEAARIKGLQRNDEPLAVNAGYDVTRNAIFIEMNNGIRFEIPRALLQGLQDATSHQLAQVKVLGTGTTIAWESPDVGFTVAGLLKGVFGSRRWMSELGRVGGSMTSKRKAAAARANGAKGGRPRSRATKRPA